MEFLTLIVLIGFAAALRYRWKVPVELLPLVAVTSIVIALYLFAFAGALRTGAYLLFAGGIVAPLILWCRDRTGFRRALADLGAPPIFVFFAGAVAYRLFFDGIQFYSWDTFAHWGYATQELLYFDTLDRSTSNNLESDYPPGINLFHYFVVFLSQHSEDRIYFANFMLLAAPLVILLGGIRNRQIVTTALLAALGYFFASTFGLSFREIPPDHTLGLLFGGAVLYFLRIGGQTPAPLPLALLGLPTLAILPLIKESGIVLAMVAAGIVAVDMVWRRSAIGGLRDLRAGLLIVLVCAAPLATWSAWHGYVSSSVSKKTFSVDAGTAAIAWDAIVVGDRNAVRQKTVDSFVDALTGRTIGNAATGAVINRLYWQLAGAWKSGEPFPEDTLIPERAVPIAVLAGIFVVLAGGVLVLTPGGLERRRIASVLSLLFLGGCGYVLVLLVLYLSVFGAGVEAQEVWYFGRYVGTYVLGAGLVLFSCISGLRNNTGTARVALATLAICLIAVVLVASRMSVSILLRISPEHHDTRKLIKARAAYAKARTADDARIYVVWQVTSGYEHRILNYDLLPRYINRACWSFGPPGVPYACNDSAGAWRQSLKGFDYVLVAKSDAYLRTRYAALFDPAELAGGKFLFAVTRDSEGQIRLRSR